MNYVAKDSPKLCPNNCDKGGYEGDEKSAISRGDSDGCSQDGAVSPIDPASMVDTSCHDGFEGQENIREKNRQDFRGGRRIILLQHSRARRHLPYLPTWTSRSATQPRRGMRCDLSSASRYKRDA